MFRFGSSGVAKVRHRQRQRERGERERGLVLRVEWGRNCVILAGAQQGSKRLRFVCMARQGFFYCQNQFSCYRVSFSSRWDKAGTLRSAVFVVQLCT
jgi:hypothetical protein